jgi:hypothetical protein
MRIRVRCTEYLPLAVLLDVTLVVMTVAADDVTPWSTMSSKKYRLEKSGRPE